VTRRRSLQVNSSCKPARAAFDGPFDRAEQARNSRQIAWFFFVGDPRVDSGARTVNDPAAGGARAVSAGETATRDELFVLHGTRPRERRGRERGAVAANKWTGSA
jgi:hypothetical protein